MTERRRWKKATPVPGDQVRYATHFLRSIGAYTGDLPFARGTVTGVHDFGPAALVTIAWANYDGAGPVLAANLEVLR